jgi:ferredoxin-NADP reductase
MPPPPTFAASLIRARALSPNVRELVLERADQAPFAFEAGQWVNLVLPRADGELRRAYSIASRPDGTPRFELAVTHVRGGPGSSFLHALEPGAKLDVVGPQGFFTRAHGEAPSPSLFVATGTGVTPLRSMILSALAANEHAPLWLLFGVRREEDILYREELARIAAQHPNVRVEITLSQPSESWTGRRGYVQTHVEELWRELATRGAPHAYACGLLRMVGSVRELLRKQMDVPRQQVHTERYD